MLIFWGEMNIQNIELNDIFSYSGKNELRIMELMINYNNNISKIFKKNIEDEKSILDFGAGIGTITKLMSDCPNLTCLEIDEEQIKTLTNKGYHVVESLEKIEDSSLSFIYSSDVLEHIEEDYKIIQDLKNKVKLNGKVVFYVPAFQFLYSDMDKKVGHYRRYNKKRLKDVFLKAGFSIEKINYCDSIGFFVSMLYKLTMSKGGNINPTMVKIYDKYIFPVSTKFDFFFNKFFGKNIYIVARRKS